MKSIVHSYHLFFERLYFLTYLVNFRVSTYSLISASVAIPVEQINGFFVLAKAITKSWLVKSAEASFRRQRRWPDGCERQDQQEEHARILLCHAEPSAMFSQLERYLLTPVSRRIQSSSSRADGLDDFSLWLCYFVECCYYWSIIMRFDSHSSTV